MMEATGGGVPRHRPPTIRKVKRRVPVNPINEGEAGEEQHIERWWQEIDRWLPRSNAIFLALLWVVVVWSLATRRPLQSITVPLETVTHDLQHVRDTMRAQSHRQIKFNIHPKENGQMLRHPAHERDFIEELDMLALQDYRLCCAWADKFICDEQRVRAEVLSAEGGRPFLQITAFIGRVDAHCTFSWTTTTTP